MKEKQLAKILIPLGFKASKTNPYEYHLQGIDFGFAQCQNKKQVIEEVLKTAYKRGEIFGKKSTVVKIPIFEIWNEEDLTTNHITDIIGEDNAKSNFRKLTLELIEELNLTNSMLIESNQIIEDYYAHYQKIFINIKACLDYSKETFQKDNITTISEDLKRLVKIYWNESDSSMQIEESLLNY